MCMVTDTKIGLRCSIFVASMLVAGQISRDLPEAFSILGYGFYLQPMMLPLLAEMPPGSLGVKLTNQAMCLVTLGEFGIITVNKKVFTMTAVKCANQLWSEQHSCCQGSGSQSRRWRREDSLPPFMARQGLLALWLAR